MRLYLSEEWKQSSEDLKRKQIIVLTLSSENKCQGIHLSQLKTTRDCVHLYPKAQVVWGISELKLISSPNQNPEVLRSK